MEQLNFPKSPVKITLFISQRPAAHLLHLVTMVTMVTITGRTSITGRTQSISRTAKGWLSDFVYSVCREGGAITLQVFFSS